MPRMIDKLDARLIKLLNEQPRVGLLEIARQLGVARGTVSARLAKLEKRGVITGFGPEIDPHALGFRILAFVWLEIYQRRLDSDAMPAPRRAAAPRAGGHGGDRDQRRSRPPVPRGGPRPRAPPGHRQHHGPHRGGPPV